MKQVVPTLFPFIKLWDADKNTGPENSPSDSKSKPKSI